MMIDSQLHACLVLRVKYPIGLFQPPTLLMLQIGLPYNLQQTRTLWLVTVAAYLFLLGKVVSVLYNMADVLSRQDIITFVLNICIHHYE